MFWKYEANLWENTHAEMFPETLQKLCLSKKFPHQEIRWNYGFLCSEQYWDWATWLIINLGTIFKIA